MNYRYGIVAYINGAEVFRDNMQEGPVGHDTSASASYVETSMHGFIRPGSEVSGNSVLAVELHFTSSASPSDVDFDAFLAILSSSVEDESCVIYPYATTITSQPSSSDITNVFDMDKTSYTVAEDINNSLIISYAMDSNIIPFINGLRYTDKETADVVLMVLGGKVNKGLVNKLQNTYDVKTIDGTVLKAKAVRVNPGKNTALMHLDKPANYTPIALNLDLPAIDKEGFISLGLLDKEGEAAKNYMDDDGRIYGYRYSDTLGTEIIVDTLVQKVSVGSVLIDSLGTVNGISNSAKQTEEGMDLFIPTETALRSVGLSICEKLYDKKSPWQKTVYKPVTEKVKEETKGPEAMPEADRK